MGIRGPKLNTYEIGGKFGVLPRTAQGKWYPPLVYGKETYITEFHSGFKLSPDSKYSSGFKELPSSNIWDSKFAGIPEVVLYWSERERWEQKFKLALAAEPENFEEEWQNSVDYLKSIVNIDKMASEMTKVVWDNIN